MNIVIDIPEDVIKGAKSSPNYYPAYHFEKIWKAIVNGTPLPNGRLIDADSMKTITEETMKKLKIGDTVYVACKVDAVFIGSGMIQVSTRDCDNGFDAYEDEVLDFVEAELPHLHDSESEETE